jgi:hypothetical protein
MGEPANFAFLTSRKSFDEVFPNVEDAHVWYTESGEGDWKVSRWSMPGSLRSHSTARDVTDKHFHNVRNGVVIKCGNPRCRRGGFNLALVLVEMTASRETEREGSLSCRGDEGSAQGRRRGKSCGNEMKYKVTVKYKPL